MRRLLPLLLLLLMGVIPARAADPPPGRSGQEPTAGSPVRPSTVLRLGDPHFRGPLAKWNSVRPDEALPESDGRILSPDLHGPTTGPVHRTRLWLMGGTMFAANAAIVAYFFDTYYNDDFAKTAPFHTFDDWYNADLNVDKLGHIWSAQSYAQATYHMFRWANMSQWSAMYWSSGLAFLYQLEMEITDGLFEKWGFSWWDVAGNTIGAVWPNLQRIYPSLQPFMIKMSYHPSAAVKQGWVEHDYLRDYDGFTYWLALSVEDLLPRAARPYWPDWLGIAVGYGANRTMLGDGIYNSRDGVGQGEQEWYVALDYDLRKLPGDSKFLLWMKESFNIFHLPAPTIRITPSAVYYGLYF
ncbi:MAG: DUF2279 domain-containing protein [Bacteroidetes bacterium]|nr:DUF2279 domain-containing protein [Bacteroidota bacterium]